MFKHFIKNFIKFFFQIEYLSENETCKFCCSFLNIWDQTEEAWQDLGTRGKADLMIRLDLDSEFGLTQFGIKKACSQDMWPGCNALCVTLDIRYNLQVIQYSLQAIAYIWEIPLLYPL